MRSEKLWLDSGFTGSVFFGVHRMAIKNKDYAFTNDVKRIFQHKNDCQSPKQIINSVSEGGSLS